MDPFLDYRTILYRDQFRSTTALPINIQASLLLANQMPHYQFYPNGGFCGGAYPPVFFDLPVYYPGYYGAGNYYRGGHHHYR
jgi:hypothetical protein